MHRYEGYIAQHTGDCIVALFGAPIVREDHAQQALYSALLMQARIAKQRDKLGMERGLSIQIRVGVHSGQVIIRSIGEDDLRLDYAPAGRSKSLTAGLGAALAGQSR